MLQFVCSMDATKRTQRQISRSNEDRLQYHPIAKNMFIEKEQRETDDDQDPS